MEYIFIFLIGISVGSFLNVLIDRLPRRESIIKNRSHCESCKKNLHWSDLVPVFSFLFLKGRCRYCQSPISFYYPMVEVITGILFLVTFVNVQNNFQFSIFNFQFSLVLILTLVYQLFIISALIVIFFTDLKYGIIADKIVYSAIAVSFFFLLFTSQESLFQIFNFQFSIFNFLLSALGSFVFFLIIFSITRGKGMGFGDVKLSFLMGLLLGFPKIIVAFYTAFLTGAVVAIILVIWRKRRFFGGSIPFGPFLALGTLISIYWGELILENIISFLLR